MNKRSRFGADRDKLSCMGDADSSVMQKNFGISRFGRSRAGQGQKIEHRAGPSAMHGLRVLLAAARSLAEGGGGKRRKFWKDLRVLRV